MCYRRHLPRLIRTKSKIIIFSLLLQPVRVSLTRVFILNTFFCNMPLDTSIKSVLIIGSGPIVIGQACEFDYSGSQAARSLREEGIKVILINSNPATIMTDPMMADRVYLLPLTVESIEQILQENQIDAVLPTMGGQRSEERRVGKE